MEAAPKQSVWTVILHSDQVPLSLWEGRAQWSAAAEINIGFSPFVKHQPVWGVSPCEPVPFHISSDPRKICWLSYSFCGITLVGCFVHWLSVWALLQWFLAPEDPPLLNQQTGLAGPPVFVLTLSILASILYFTLVLYAGTHSSFSDSSTFSSHFVTV